MGWKGEAGQGAGGVLIMIAAGAGGSLGGALTGAVSTGLALRVILMASALNLGISVEEVGCQVRGAATGADGSSCGDCAEVAEVAEPGAMLLAATAVLAALDTWSARICVKSGLARMAAVAS